MIRFAARRLAMAGLLFVSTTSAQAQGFLGMGDDTPTPSVSLQSPSINLNIPMPVNSANLTLLLAQAGDGGSLTALKEAKLRRYRQHLQVALGSELRQFFLDEEVPLVEGRGQLSLGTDFRLTVVKQLGDMRSEGGVDLEQGNMEMSGTFTYRLIDAGGRTLQEESLDIDRLRLREKYLVRVQRGGNQVEDTTDQAILNLLSTLSGKVLARIDGDLEADELRDLVRD
ncbi:hypothetical protein AWR36_009080 [Microbulbifer flavimaris]|uniref:Lipoprotein n=1 Tax=Microbulbifer flavimaris TaxID=1781068 RepID=A0ABX4I142_9GAMM|nr:MULTISPECIES: hypothetical protein [Microbulbifer]KUJ83952.1 hypothetical protein AVO43_09045 [Microbulbifer sp. ZGT114]PCO06129.1 hypothetical protein AWR36_009080 [Microbulbifer flavimaris]